MPKDERGKKHTVIIDADLHVQDPEEIILSYFNTGNNNQFAKGEKKSFRNRMIGIFITFIMMKFFFEEMFTGWNSFILITLTSIVLSLIFAFALPIMVHAFRNSAKNDSIRGVFYQLTFITIIVLIIGIFI